MRTILLPSSCCSVDSDASCKWALTEKLRWRVLYSRGGVWVQQLSSAEGHCRFSFQWWPTQFPIVCLCMQMSGGKKTTTDCHCGSVHHHQSPFSVVALNSSSGGELKLYLGWIRNTRWLRQILHPEHQSYSRWCQSPGYPSCWGKGSSRSSPARGDPDCKCRSYSPCRSWCSGDPPSQSPHHECQTETEVVFNWCPYIDITIV